MVIDLVAVLCLGWYIFILVVCAIGINQMCVFLNLVVHNFAYIPLDGKTSLPNLRHPFLVICLSTLFPMSPSSAQSRASSLGCTNVFHPPSNRSILFLSYPYVFVFLRVMILRYPFLSKYYLTFLTVMLGFLWKRKIQTFLTRMGTSTTWGQTQRSGT